jgi:hypothetical protein
VTPITLNDFYNVRIAMSYQLSQQTARQDESCFRHKKHVINLMLNENPVHEGFLAAAATSRPLVGPPCVALGAIVELQGLAKAAQYNGARG